MFNTSLPYPNELPTSSQLLKSTIIGIISAAVLLVVAVLPAEYGIDPTGLGRVLGLTQMGEIKTQLAQEAADDRLEDVAQAVSSTEAPTVSDEAAMAETSSEDPVISRSTASIEAEETVDPAPEPESWQDSLSITLQPGEATEVKLTMTGGATASYEWDVDQAGLNSDLHGDHPDGDFISYRQGRNEAGDAGQFEAEFDGSHGWFWRNRSDVAVTVTLRTRGDYAEFNRMF